MLDKMKAHLTANLSLTCLVWAVILFCVWTFLPVGIILRIVISLVGLLVSGYIGHRLFPQVTGPIVEKLYQRKQKKFKP